MKIIGKDEPEEGYEEYTVFSIEVRSKPEEKHFFLVPEKSVKWFLEMIQKNGQPVE